jgi:hypothetical protein
VATRGQAPKVRMVTGRCPECLRRMILVRRYPRSAASSPAEITAGRLEAELAGALYARRHAGCSGERRAEAVMPL